jgi:hypothetical protein
MTRTVASTMLLMFTISGCASGRTGAWLPPKTMKDYGKAEWPADLPGVEIRRVDLDKAVQDKEHLLCDSTKQPPHVDSQFLSTMHINLATHAASDNPGVAGGWLLGKVASTIEIKSFEVSCSEQGAFVSVNGERYGPYDRVYRGHFQGSLSTSDRHCYGIAGYSAQRREFIHVVVSNFTGPQFVSIIDLSRYVPAGSISFAAVMKDGVTASNVEGYLVPADPTTGWFILGPLGGMFGKPWSIGLSKYRVEQ